MTGPGTDGPTRPTPPTPPAILGEPGAPRPRTFAPVTAEGDAALLRVVGVIVVLAVVLIMLVLPPVSVLDRDSSSDTGVSTRARGDFPELPAGLTPLSSLYDLTVAESIVGPATLTVRLDRAPDNERNLALYSFDDGSWQRLASATLASPETAEGVVEHIPSTIAVVERSALANGIAFTVGADAAPDPLAGGDGAVTVPAAFPALDAEGAPTVLDVEGSALGAAFASGHPVYLGVGVRPEGDASIVDTILASPDLLELHASRIAEAATEQGVAGIYLDYRDFDPALRDAFTALAQQLGTALAAQGIALAVAIEAPAGDAEGAFDWPALAAAADTLWLHGPTDLDEYYSTLESALAGAVAQGLDTSAVWLVVDRRSREQSAEGVRPITLREALTEASLVRTRIEGGIAPGDGVTLEAANLGGAGGEPYGWSDRARAVTFTFQARGGERTVWVENRYSLAFRLDLASRFGLGGVVVAAAEADDTLPDVWNTVSSYAEEGSVRLELPYGPYLEAEWRASSGAIEGTGPLVVWRAPEAPGIYDLTLLISDGVVFVGQQFALRVIEDGTREEPTPTVPAPGPAGN